MALKVGDKIEIKRKPEQVNLEDKYESTLKEIASLLRRKNRNDYFKLEWLGQSEKILQAYFDEEPIKSCQLAKNTFIPIAEKLIEKAKPENINDFFNIYKRLYAFAGRRDLECFIDYMEFEKPVRVLANRREALAPLVYALNKVRLDEKLKYVIASYPPSLGKSFCLNYYTAWTYGVDMNTSNLRLSYNEDLVLGFSRSIKDIISNPLFSDVFPNFKVYGGKPFEKEKESDWKIKNSNVLTSHISRTRDGGTTGVRANTTIEFDDMTKGAEESTNADLHRKLYDKWKTEWYNRRDGKSTKFVFAGTMWSPEDILNRVREDREALSPLIPSDKYKYMWESEDGSTIVIRVPLLDENDESTCPEVYTTEEARNIRDTTDEYLFSCVYQQDPIAPTGLEFAYELLKTYQELPKFEDGTPAYTEYSYGALDPSRRGKDNVSLPIFKKDLETGEYYLVECVFKQKAMSELYDEIVDKIIENNVIDLVVENNTDTSLKSLLEERLQGKGYNMCIIREKYNVKNKEQRIKDMRGHLKRNILFKEKTRVKPNTDYGRFMKNFTTYSFDYPAKHDDAPDSLALFTAETIVGMGIISKVVPISRQEYGI